jgi:hypothetical protein
LEIGLFIAVIKGVRLTLNGGENFLRNIVGQYPYKRHKRPLSHEMERGFRGEDGSPDRLAIKMGYL